MIPWLDFKLFGSGWGLGAPHYDQTFYFLNGHFYTWIGGLGAQLQSIQWTTPKPGEYRKIQGIEFRPFNTTRRGPRVMVSWAMTDLHGDLDFKNLKINQFKENLKRI